MARPQLEWVPLMHWMAEQSNENVRRQHSQDMVEKYDWSHFVARHEVRRL